MPQYVNSITTIIIIIIIIVIDKYHNNDNFIHKIMFLGWACILENYLEISQVELKIVLKFTTSIFCRIA